MASGLRRTALIRLYVSRVDFHAHPLTDQIDRQHQSCVRPLADQASDNTSQRAVYHLDPRPLADQWARIILQVGLDQMTYAVDLDLGNGCNLTVERDDVDDTRTLKHGQTYAGIEAREAVARKQRPVDLLLAVLPSALARNGRKKDLDPVALELSANDLFMPRARPDRVPRPVNGNVW